MRLVTDYVFAFATVALTAALLGAVGAEVEEDVAIADLPRAVADALEAEYPDGELLEAEKETEGDETVYEVEVRNAGKTLEVELTPDGKILEVEEETDDEDGDGD